MCLGKPNKIRANLLRREVEKTCSLINDSKITSSSWGSGTMG